MYFGAMTRYPPLYWPLLPRSHQSLASPCRSAHHADSYTAPASGDCVQAYLSLTCPFNPPCLNSKLSHVLFPGTLMAFCAVCTDNHLDCSQGSFHSCCGNHTIYRNLLQNSTNAVTGKNFLLPWSNSVPLHCQVESPFGVCGVLGAEPE